MHLLQIDAVFFPLFDGLKDDEQEYIIEEVKKSSI